MNKAWVAVIGLVLLVVLGYTIKFEVPNPVETDKKIVVEVPGAKGELPKPKFEVVTPAPEKKQDEDNTVINQ